ncbi:unnamed protein product, partial [Discosporangium mesarthrocarpum]
WAHVRSKIDLEKRRRGLQSTYESVEIGQRTLETLTDQQERLEHSEVVLDSTNYVVERSARVLRGMTLWGKIQNAFSNEPEVPQSYRVGAAGRAGRDLHEANGDGPRVLERVEEDMPLEGFICPDCRRDFDTAEALVQHFGLVHDWGEAGAGAGAGASTRREERGMPRGDSGTGVAGAEHWLEPGWAGRGALAGAGEDGGCSRPDCLCHAQGSPPVEAPQAFVCPEGCAAG